MFSRIADKRVVLLLSCVACATSIFEFGTSDSGSRHWSISDPFCALLVTVCAINLVRQTWKVDAPAIWMSAYIATLGLTSLIHGTFGAGPLLNQARTEVWALALYIVASNVVKTVADVKFFHMCAAGLAVFLVCLSGVTLLNVWGSRFTNVFFLMGSMELNAWGFALVLLLCSLAMWWGEQSRSISRLTVVLMVVAGIALSLSRSAYANALIAGVIISFGAQRKKSWKGIVAVSLIVVTLLMAQSKLFEFVPEAKRFADEKISTFSSDVVNTRLYLINALPVQKWTGESWDVIFIGDGLTFQHSLLSNTLWMTGLTGGLFMALYHLALFLKGVSLWSKSGRRAELVFNPGAGLIAVMIVMLNNDLTTNHRNYAGIIAYIFSMTAGSLAGYERGLTARIQAYNLLTKYLALKRRLLVGRAAAGFQRATAGQDTFDELSVGGK